MSCLPLYLVIIGAQSLFSVFESKLSQWRWCRNWTMLWRRSGRATCMLFLAWPPGTVTQSQSLLPSVSGWLWGHKILTALIPGSGGSANNHLPALLLTWDTWHPLVIHNTQGRPHLPRGLLLISVIPQLLPLVWNISTIPVHSSIPSLPSLPFVSPTSASLGRRSSDRWHPAAAVAMVISVKKKHHPRSIDCRIRRMQEMEMHSWKWRWRVRTWKFRPSRHKFQEWSLSRTHSLKDAILSIPATYQSVVTGPKCVIVTGTAVFVCLHVLHV